MNKISITTLKAQIQKLFIRAGIKKERGAESAWAILVAIAILVALTTSVFHIYLFTQVKNDKIFQITEVGENNQTEINVGALQETINQFDQKEERFNMFLNERPILVDPSL